ERMLVLAVWSTVNPQQQRDLRAFDVTGGVRQQTIHLRAVFALKADFLSRPEIQFGKQRVALRRQLAQLVAVDGVDLTRFRVATGYRNCSSTRGIQRRDDDG